MTGRTPEVVGIVLTAIVAIITLGIVTGLVTLIARGIRLERYEEAAQQVNGLGHPARAVGGDQVGPG